MKIEAYPHPRGELVDGFKLSNHPSYRPWQHMLARCRDEKLKSYGAKGVSVCERWLSFKNFAADMGVRPSGTTLDRIDVDGNYEPSNCRWATPSAQCLNRGVFSNNSSGHTGVIRAGKRWLARMDYNGTRYNIGWFETKVKAVEAREKFQTLFDEDSVAAVASIEKGKARSTSKTSVRGINPHRSGGFTVRLNVNKERIYLGYYCTLEEAIDAKQRFIETRVGGFEG